jgi:hypothetical protein
VLAYAIYIFFSGFSLFLLGLSIFMYHEGRKFGDNQFTIKLLPPPPKLSEAETVKTQAVVAVKSQTVVATFTGFSGYARKPAGSAVSTSR